ncbi:hypothetical protein PENSPDRAFT_218270 [Peniophora sp. CONT]|nr:hypothetical protein PENSPDRAFT_218270 [Peniophora sp. CONT]
MAPTRHQRALKAARLQAAESRAALEYQEMRAQVMKELNISAEELATLLRGESPKPVAPRPRLPTLGLVGIGLDRIFAPAGCISMPRSAPKHDPRSLDWMRISNDDMKPLIAVREELIQARNKLNTVDQARTFDTARVGIAGRRLRSGEAPPF